MSEKMRGEMPEKQPERVNDFHEGGADKVFSIKVNAKTAEHGLEFNEQGKATVSGAELVNLIEQGVFGEPKYHTFEEDAPMPRLDHAQLSSIENIELDLSWEHAHFSLPIVPDEIRETDPEATETNWAVQVNMSKEERDDMWYETRLHLGWTQEEVEQARKAGSFQRPERNE